MNPIKTKTDYKDAVQWLIAATKQSLEISPPIYMYVILLRQLVFIENIVIKENRALDDKEYARLTIGRIAVKNFDCENEKYGYLLCEIHGNAKPDVYMNLPEQ
jgi:hypothetical protein